MEKVVRLMGTLLVLSLIFVACKKDDFSDGKKGGKDTSFKDDFSTSKKDSEKSEKHDNSGDREDEGEDDKDSDHGKKIAICHNGHLINISINAVPHHFKEHSTDLLFSCDSKGIVYSDITSFLNKLIVDNNLQGSAQQQQVLAFNMWYNNYYLVGNWPLLPTMGVCHNGQVINVRYTIAFADFQNGDILFSCDPSTGVFYSDVEGPLLDIIYDYSLNANANDIMYQAFLIWYKDFYLTGNWPPAGGGAGGGGTGGSGTGTDSTVVITN